MNYRSEVPEDRQREIHQFRLTPNSRLLIKYKGVFRPGRVVEVGSANPEYVLWRQGKLKKRPSNAKMKRWNTQEEEGFQKFLIEHPPAKMRLLKSMWVVVEVIIPVMRRDVITAFRAARKRLYTYDIEELIQSAELRIIYL